MVEKPRSASPCAEGGAGDGEREAPARAVRYSEKLAEAICARLAKGDPWASFCGEHGMPPYSKLYEWRARHPVFAERVAEALRQAADHCADQALTVAQRSTKETAQQDRLLVGILMKRAALLAPGAWGGKGGAGAKGKAKPVTFRIRHFEKVVGPDGKAFVRELKPEGVA